MGNINCPAAWDTLQLQGLSLGAMPPGYDLNTGIDATHPDLAANIVNSHDFSGSGINDTDGHGTYCAGFIGAITNNSTGVASVGWGGSMSPPQ